MVTLAPVSNLLTATGIVMAERVLFLPSVGLAMAFGAALQARRATNEAATSRASTTITSAGRWQALGFATVLVLWGIGLTVRSATRVDTWRTQRQFYVALPRDAPLAYRAWKGAAEYWEGAGDHRRAIAMLRHALELWPHDYQVHERLGQFLRTDGQCAAAIPVLAAGVKLDPDVSSMRAKLIECAIVARQWDIADRYAADALALGQTEFQSVRLRVAQQRRAAESTPPPP
jgi:tetratricopeptide (TPR) repeat protein